MRVALTCVAFAFVLSGCQTVSEYRAERRAIAAGNACDRYGFTRGTPEYLACITSQTEAATGEAAAQANRSAALLGYSARLLRPTPVAAPVRTTCSRMGIYTNCTTY